jgi:phage-related protein
MNWHIIFFRNVSGQCPFEKFIDNLPKEDAEEVVASVAALRELGNMARRPLADYLGDGIYELRARRLKKQFRILYSFAGRRKILILTGFVKKSRAVPAKEIKKALALKKNYLEQVKGE